jgi:hypothetical protein
MKQENRIAITSEICEASGCSAKSTATIEIPIEEKGTFLLFVCEKCLTKFQRLGLNANYRINQSLYSRSMVAPLDQSTRTLTPPTDNRSDMNG